MKALVFSDIHLDAVTAGAARRAEVLEFVGTAMELAIRHEVELVVFAGDAHNPGSLLDPLYTADLIRRIFAFARATLQFIVVAVAGNHDVVDTSELFLGSPVTTLTPVRAAAIACLSSEEAARVHVFDRPYTRMIAPGWAVLALPYVSRVHATNWDAWDRHAFGTAQRYVDDGVRLIVVAHRVVPGAQISSESIEMAKGQDLIFPFDEVAKLKPAFVINGHYHSRQTVEHDGLSISIPGSPLRFTFGEAEQVAKGVMIVEIV